MEKIRAIALLSGGLDSTLSAKIIQNEGVDVIGVNFYTGLCVIERKRLLGEAKGNIYLDTVSQLGIPVEVVDISEGYIDVVLNPRYGYGANANPCLDCKIYMFRKAKELLSKFDAKFIVTGEVLGQRPMSQQRHQLMLIEKESGLKGLIVRPLSLRLLPETIPEKMGWINREHFYAISGRTRKKQFELAEKFGIRVYPQPAGGCCFLTDENYARRFFDYINCYGKDRFTRKEALLLAFGRHFRLNEKVKLIVGRDKRENRLLEELSDGKVLCFPVDVKGPVALIEGEADEKDILKACSILARYCKTSEGKVRVKVKQKDKDRILTVKPAVESEVDEMRI